MHTFQDRGYGRDRERNMFMEGQELRKVLEAGVKVFGTVELDDGAADFIRDGGSRFAASVAVNKESLALRPVAGQHAVDVPPGAAKSHGGTVFVADGLFCQVGNCFVLL